MFYQFRLTSKSIFFDRQTLWLFFAFFGLRLLSWFIVDHPIAQGILMFLVIMAFGILYYENPKWAWYVLIGEILLGGAGHFLDLLGLSLRSVLTIIFLMLWASQTLANKNLRERLHIRNSAYYIGFPFFIFLIVAIGLGFWNGHNVINIAQDIVPYMYLILLLPAYHLFQEEDSHEYLVRLLTVFIIGSAILSLIIFITFSADLASIHGDFYAWLRNISMGKITDMGNGFFRVVLPEHLLMVPISLIIASLLMRDEKHHTLWRYLLFSCMLVLALNLSRGYFLALGAGLIVLLWKHKIIEWIKECAFLIVLLIASFTCISLVASNLTSTGWQLFGVRLLSISSPTIETSSNIRLTLLDPILRKIEERPFFGHGLGATVKYTDPSTLELKETNQFDWGYLEMWTELGLLGAGTYIVILLLLAFQLIQKTRSVADYHDFYVGLLAGLVSFLVMNITAPALFHVFGLLFVVFSATYIMKPPNIFDRTITILYRVFHRLKLPKFM